MDQNIIPFDLHRMFLGEQPLLFYAEILVRTLIIYIYTLLMIRWIGGRGIAQLSMVEFVLVIALGSAVGDAMFYPEVPLLVAMLVITVVISANKLLDLLLLRSDRAKDLIDGRPVELVRDGRLVHEGLNACDMGPAEIRGLLREAGIRNLGQVQHAYLESSGKLSIFRRPHARPGLPLLPPDGVFPSQDRPAPLRDPALAPGGLACCLTCGATARAATVLPDGVCEFCSSTQWIAPAKEEREPE
ncbi:DUF421 domain-containing protein [Paracoccus caeni]|uniref:DUF421 domain-containing protein n=1 Tax=Paracoccus caeni TaxID=657651 RepID=A0A934SCW6_9RHOB|nr:YetF domain-containing protein [Paracoccus caeni]MBK4215019.1 DUF421 domain-containing protein [Paracoccus caeni]